MRRIAESGRRLVAIAATGVVALAALASPAQAQSAGTNRSNAVVVSNPDLARALGGGIGTLARGDGPYVVYISGVRVELSFAEQWLDRGGVWEFGSSKLTMQWDGNLVVYNRNTGAVKWSPNIFGRGGVQMVFQYDANLVVYTSNRSVVWASNKVLRLPERPRADRSAGRWQLRCLLRLRSRRRSLRLRDLGDRYQPPVIPAG